MLLIAEAHPAPVMPIRGRPKIPKISRAFRATLVRLMMIAE
jgi:hypothetical protein